MALKMAITTEGYWTMWRLKSPGLSAFYCLYKSKICNRHYINEVCSCAPALKEVAGPDSSWSRMTGWKAKSGCPWDSNCSKSTLWRHGKILPIGGGVNPGIDHFSSKGDWKENEEVSKSLLGMLGVQYGIERFKIIRMAYGLGRQTTGGVMLY